uniref:Uncharacterized protein n=1 Tax=Cereibacter sphaeroides (strain ATCC 17025 / ATH 2.4.3) TaxID=349102 RepID=A4WS26_CERS5
MTHLPPPPQHVEPFVRVLGPEGAVEFLLAFGGGEIYLAATPKGRSRLVEMVGVEKAAALADAVGQMKLRVPTAKPWIARCLRAQGLAIAEIARRLHATDVSVRRWLKESGHVAVKDPRQMRLF